MTTGVLSRPVRRRQPNARPANSGVSATPEVRSRAGSVRKKGNLSMTEEKMADQLDPAVLAEYLKVVASALAEYRKAAASAKAAGLRATLNRDEGTS